MVRLRLCLNPQLHGPRYASESAPGRRWPGAALSARRGRRRAVARLPAALARDFSVIVPSHPGHGGSPPAEWIEHISDLAFHYLDLLDELGLEQRAPGRRLVRRLDRRRDGHDGVAPSGSLVLIDPVGIKVDGWIYPFLFGMELRTWSATIFHKPVAALALTPPDESWIRSWSLPQSAALARVAWNPYLYNPLLRRRLARITTPTLLCWGAHDRLAPLGVREAWRKEIPGAACAFRRFRPRAAHRGAGRGGGGGRRILAVPGGEAMKFYYFHLMPYTMDHDEPSSWVTLPEPPLRSRRGPHALPPVPRRARVRRASSGCDGICVNEHHQNAYGLMPAPNIMAAALVAAHEARQDRHPRQRACRCATTRCASPRRSRCSTSSRGGRIISGFVRGIGCEYYSLRR